jgi:hypothetical protein
MKKSLCIYFLFISFSSFCQDVDAFGKQASKESQAYYFYRQQLSEPPYGLKWIKEKISHRKYGASDTESNRIFYQSLSLREKFTYNMIHAESYSQIKKTESKTIAHARGGSWWCSKNSCGFFNSYNIGWVNIHASFSNQGFRVVK